MRKDASSHFMIGLFVLIGVSIGFVFVFWLGVSRYSQTGETYAAYFDESVQGLQADSSVKYRGVDVGRVEKIRVAPDNRLIEVVMKIDLRADPEKTMVATLKAAGITGIVFVELNRRDPGKPDLSPEIPFPSEYPIIPSQPSEIRRFLSGADEVVEKLKKIDFEGIAERVKSLARSTDELLSGKRTDAILRNLESLTAGLDRVVGRVEDVSRRGLVEETLEEARKTLAEIRSLAAAAEKELKAMKLEEASGKADLLLGTLEERSRLVGYDMEAAGENLRRASETLDRLLERLYDRPSDLLFGGPPAGE
ncbi:MAG TPA: MlaD family protein [Syntrophales bacterium]|nr:MlaD family protein [Syntrophales bacterium]HPX11910.1 MlaD family protein [Syntrophales bacterium]HQB31082.1 MlaD family protein [Syntrophales bacterium]HQN78956.1 MlaD family protein [Syntrophales bacterium]HQQ28049.1 MlaD family protein [Syntrophales bacterium]